jgi:CspA family cold shock protein
MNYRDTLVTCQECGKQYVFTVETQRQLDEKGLDITPPEMCASCVQKVKYGGRYHGRIKWFSLEKGYGFIVGDGGKEIFFHRNSVALGEDGGQPTLEENQEVLFDVIDSPKGPQAAKVSIFLG